MEAIGVKDLGLEAIGLFDGCAMFREALKRLGIGEMTYYSSEIDRHASKIARKDHRDLIPLGDVTKVNGRNLRGSRILVGGSPCQGFSNAGKRLNFEDPRSKLFFEFLRIKEEARPDYWILENVKMKKEWVDIISGFLKVDPIEIDSGLVSAQQRKRLFWTNIPGISLPADRGIMLDDVLQDLSYEEALPYMVDEEFFKGGKLQNHIAKERTLAAMGKPLRVGTLGKGGQGNRIYDPSRKAITLSAQSGGAGSKTGLYALNWSSSTRYDKTTGDFSHYEDRFGVNEKANTLTTAKGCGGNKSLNVVQGVDDGSVYLRKLTEIECERLQTLPDDYTKGVSSAQRYKMLGNGFTVEVIMHLIKGII